MSTHNICFHGKIKKIFTWLVILSGAMTDMQCKKRALMSFGNSEDLDQLGYSSCLIRTFVAPLRNQRIL